MEGLYGWGVGGFVFASQAKDQGMCTAAKVEQNVRIYMDFPAEDVQFYTYPVEHDHGLGGKKNCS